MILSSLIITLPWQTTQNYLFVTFRTNPSMTSKLIRNSAGDSHSWKLPTAYLTLASEYALSDIRVSKRQRSGSCYQRNLAASVLYVYLRYGLYWFHSLYYILEPSSTENMDIGVSICSSSLSLVRNSRYSFGPIITIDCSHQLYRGTHSGQQQDLGISLSHFLPLQTGHPWPRVLPQPMSIVQLHPNLELLRLWF